MFSGQHEVVPAELVASIAALRGGGCFKVLRNLLKHKLVYHENVRYDGYRLTYQGYDFLALRALVGKGAIVGLGRQIGVGKESDVYEAITEEGEAVVVKFHRLGRTSFRAVKSKRDYLRGRTQFSWLYLSRLAAVKEYAFMRALKAQGLPVPEGLAHNRHCVLMSKVPGRPLCQMVRADLPDPAPVFRASMAGLVAIARLGLVHCDFNEFNILVADDKTTVNFIDFPQMISVRHPNARELFTRDVECLLRFFQRKMHYDPEDDDELEPELLEPTLEAAAAGALGEGDAEGGGACAAMDRQLHASGFHREHAQVLEEWERQDRGLGEEDAGGWGESSSEGPGGVEGTEEGDECVEKQEGEVEYSGDLGGQGASSSGAAEAGEEGAASRLGGSEDEAGDAEEAAMRERAEQVRLKLKREQGRGKGSGGRNSNKNRYGRRSYDHKHTYRPGKDGY